MTKSKELWSLAPYCEVLEFDGSLHIGFGSIRQIVSDSESKTIAYKILGAANEQRRFPPDFEKQLSDEKSREIFDKLINNRIIVPLSQVPVPGRYHRDQSFFLLRGGVPDDVSQKISGSTVCIVGCGGIGSFVALSLAASGVGSLILIDDDVVEEHNLTRQFLFKEGDIGRKKTEIIKRELLDRNSNVRITTIDRRLDFDEPDSFPLAADLFILAADQKGIIPKANRFFVRERLPFLHICYVNDIAVWGPFVIPGETGCWDCANHIGSPNVDEDVRRTKILESVNGSYICPVISPVSNIASSYACLDILSFLGSFGMVQSKNRRIGMWTHNISKEIQTFEKNDACVTCSKV